MVDFNNEPLSPERFMSFAALPAVRKVLEKRLSTAAPTTPETESPPPTEQAEESTGTVFTSSDLAELHERQEALEIDRRKQEQAARERDLSAND